MNNLFFFISYVHLIGIENTCLPSPFIRIDFGANQWTIFSLQYHYIINTWMRNTELAIKIYKLLNTHHKTNRQKHTNTHESARSFLICKWMQNPNKNTHIKIEQTKHKKPKKKPKRLKCWSKTENIYKYIVKISNTKSIKKKKKKENVAIRQYQIGNG